VYRWKDEVLMSKDFDSWNTLKKRLNSKTKDIFFKERDIFWASIGLNIGYEQDGKSDLFSRPVLIMKKYNKNIFLGIPLSSKIKDDEVTALLVQARLFDAKRLENKIGKISTDEFKLLKNKYGKLNGL